MFPDVVLTDRLRLERLTFGTVDVLDLYDICAHDPEIDEVTRHVLWDPHETPKETHDFVAESMAAWDDGERAEYLIRPRDGEEGAGAVAGMTGIRADWPRRTANFGIWLRRRFWGRGYAGERAAALFQLAFDRLDFELVSAAHVVGNENSRRAIERYVEAHGGQYDGLLRNWHPLGDEIVDAHRYTVTQRQWREATADRDPVATFAAADE